MVDRKVHFPRYARVPDQIIVTPAKTCFVETKSDVGSVRRQQIRVITMMRRAGAHVYVAHTREDVDAIIQELSTYNQI